MSIEKQLLIDYRTKLDKAVNLLSEMVCQADEDTPGEYRTRHFRECMDDCIDFIKDCRANDKVRGR